MVIKLTNALANTNGNAIQNNSDFAIPNGYICTLDTSNIKGKMQLANALNGAVSAKDVSNVALRVTDIVTIQGARARTGEACTNTYLITDDGTVYFSQSDGIARSVKVLVALFTDPSTGRFSNPVEQGIGLMIKEQNLPNGNTLKTVVPVELD